MKLTIIPDIIFRGSTIDYSDFDGAGNRGRKTTRTFRLLPETPITISVPFDVRKSIQQNRKKYSKIIRTKLIEIIKDAIQVGMDNDISLLTGTPSSPPIIIKKPRNWDNAVVQDL